MVDYDRLLEFAKKQKMLRCSVRKNYFVLSNRRFKYHLTIFEDQWNGYESTTGNPYHLFHISSNDDGDTRCSIYFWVDKKTMKVIDIPKDKFIYEQQGYSMTQSERKRCFFKEIIPLIKMFERLLSKIL